MPPTTHSRFGASKSSRWRNCPGSIAAEEGKVDRPTPYAMEGTAAHELGEMCLHNEKPARSYIGDIITVVKGYTDEGGVEQEVTKDFEVGLEMADAVQVYLDHIWGNLFDDDEMFIEHQFTLDALNPPEPVWGTSDCTIWNERLRLLKVIDYKHGAGVPVDAVGNTQGLQYALGAAVDIAQRTGKRPEKIVITIVQPRAPHSDGPIREWEITWADLVEDKKVMFAAIEAALEEDAPRSAGSWCRFCKAKAECPAMRKQSEELVRVEFSVEQPQPAVPPAPADLSDEELVTILQQRDMVTDWLKAVEAHALDRLIEGAELPGYKLVRGKKHRRWTDAEKADSFLARYGLKVDERYKRTLISPAQAERLVPEEKKHLIEKYWEQPEGDLKLAPATDSRPAVSAGEEFPTLPASAE